VVGTGGGGGDVALQRLSYIVGKGGEIGIMFFGRRDLDWKLSCNKTYAVKKEYRPTYDTKYSTHVKCEHKVGVAIVERGLIYILVIFSCVRL
jgi:hypothetical protein